MIIECNNLDQFLENLQDMPQIYLERVYFSESELIQGHLKAVNCTATAIGVVGESMVMLQMRKDCGQDVMTKDGSSCASEMADGIESKLLEVCQKRGLKLMPGEVRLS